MSEEQPRGSEGRDKSIPMRFKSKLIISVAVVLTAAVGPLIAADQPGAKGIYVENRETGVRFDVMLLRGAERRLVPTSYEFVSGDKMLFQFALNRDAYCPDKTQHLSPYRRHYLLRTFPLG